MMPRAAHALSVALALGAAAATANDAGAQGNEPRAGVVASAAAPSRAIRRELRPFRSAPFPYAGRVPATGRPFLDVATEDRSGRMSPRTGLVLWADETYSDNRVLLEVPADFRPGEPGLLVVFLHGNGATLERDVIARQQVSRQVHAAGLNAVLVAPQLAVDAPDSSAGKLWQPGAFTALLDEAAPALARLHGRPGVRRAIRDLPILVIAYSGGYHPLAWVLHHGAPGERILGVVLLDALYGDIEKFVAWIAGVDGGFFVSAYTPSTHDGNALVTRILGERQIPIETRMPLVLSGRLVVLVAAPERATHADFVTSAWVDDPVRDLLRRLEPGSLIRRP